MHVVVILLYVTITLLLSSFQLSFFVCISLLAPACMVVLIFSLIILGLFIALIHMCFCSNESLLIISHCPCLLFTLSIRKYLRYPYIWIHWEVCRLCLFSSFMYLVTPNLSVKCNISHVLFQKVSLFVIYLMEVVFAWIELLWLVVSKGMKGLYCFFHWIYAWRHIVRYALVFLFSMSRFAQLTCVFVTFVWVV